MVTLDEAKRLTFEMASHSLAGFSYNNDKELTDLINLFEEFISGLFSLKIDLPGFQFHKVIYGKCIIITWLCNHKLLILFSNLAHYFTNVNYKCIYRYLTTRVITPGLGLLLVAIMLMLLKKLLVKSGNCCACFCNYTALGF